VIWRRRAKPGATLHLVPLYCGERAHLLDPLAERLGATFGLQVEQHAPHFDPEQAFDGGRGQYNTRVLLARLREAAPPGASRVLGVTAVDLFVPVLTYVFGEAELDGPSAVVSAFRLDNELYGLPADPELLFARLVKEAVHELGHTYALLHCRRSSCVMNSSTYVEGIDLKSDRFCDSCLRALRRRLAGG
jgi:archaemetzincin